MTGFLDKLKDNDSEGSEMVEERPAYEESTPETDESDSELNTVEENTQQESSSSSDIGISSLMDKRAKLEEAIDYVGTVSYTHLTLPTKA